VWQFSNIKLSFAFLPEFLNIFIQFSTITSLIAVIVVTRVGWFSKPEDKEDILRNFRAFMKVFIGGAIFFLTSLLTLGSLKQYENDWIVFFIPIVIVGVLVSFSWYFFCGILSFIREFKEPELLKKSKDTDPI
jgi:hypothetical protein